MDFHLPVATEQFKSGEPLRASECTQGIVYTRQWVSILPSNCIDLAINSRRRSEGPCSAEGRSTKPKSW